MMFKEAEARGATIMQGVATSALRDVHGSLRGIVMRRPDGTEEEIETGVVRDCSGFHPDRLTLSSRAGSALGTGFTGRRDRGVDRFGWGSRNRSRCKRSCAPIATAIVSEDEHSTGNSTEA
jgi:hypothetical protein